MINYKGLAALYKEYKDKAKALYDEWEVKAKAIEPNVQVHNPFTLGDWVQTYPDAPSEGAKLNFEDAETAYYRLTVDGVTFSEAVDK